VLNFVIYNCNDDESIKNHLFSIENLFIELSVPCETNITKDHSIKINRYYELTNELIGDNYMVSFYAVDVEARGIPAKSFYNLLF
jgi:hypothetical protein